MDDVKNWKIRNGELMNKSVKRANKNGLHVKDDRKLEENEKVEVGTLVKRKKDFWGKALKEQKERKNENTV